MTDLLKGGIELSKGALHRMFSDVAVESAVLQVLGYNKLDEGFCLLVSDSIHQSDSTILSSHLNDLIENDIKIYTVIRIDRYFCNAVNSTKMMLKLLDITVLFSGECVCSRIGNPTTYSLNDHIKADPLDCSSQQSSQLSSSRLVKPIVDTVEIASLTPHSRNWTICALVTNKWGIRPFNKNGMEGKFFSMHLHDHSGVIRATAFNEACDKFFDLIEDNKTYRISQAGVYIPSRPYSILNNSLEVSFHATYTQVNLCEENAEVNLRKEMVYILSVQFEFVSIDQLESLKKGTFVDVIGVCKKADDVISTFKRATGQEFRKRDLQILDNTGTEVNITIWGTAAENFDGSHYPIVAVKRAQVSGPRNITRLSMLLSSTLQINPDIEKSHQLRAWYDNGGNKIQTVNISKQQLASSPGKCSPSKNHRRQSRLASAITSNYTLFDLGFSRSPIKPSNNPASLFSNPFPTPASQDLFLTPISQDVPSISVPQNIHPTHYSQDLPLVPVSQDFPQIPVSQDLPPSPLSQDLPPTPLSQDLPPSPLFQDLPPTPLSQDLPPAATGSQGLHLPSSPLVAKIQLPLNVPSTSGLAGSQTFSYNQDQIRTDPIIGYPSYPSLQFYQSPPMSTHISSPHDDLLSFSIPVLVNKLSTQVRLGKFKSRDREELELLLAVAKYHSHFSPQDLTFLKRRLHFFVMGKTLIPKTKPADI